MEADDRCVIAIAQAIDAHVDELRATLQDAGVPVGKLDYLGPIN